MAKEYEATAVATVGADTDATAAADRKEPTQVGYLKLFRFATKFELVLLALGVLFTVLKACGMPLMIIVYGEFTTLLVDRAYRVGTSSSTVFLHAFGGGKVLTNATWEENRVEIINDSISYGILMTIVSLLQFVTGIFSIDLFNYTALKQVTRMRVKFFGALLRQEVGWYDVSKDMNFAVRISGDIEKIRAGIGEQVSHFLTLMVGFVICVTMSFVYGWKLTLVVIGYVPIILVTNTIISRFQVRLTARESSTFAVASSVAEEVLGGIRTVKAFGGEAKEAERYARLLRPAQRAGIRKGLYSAIGEAVMRFLFYASNALAYWYGVGLVLDDRDKEIKEYTPAVLMIAFFGLIVGAENVSKTAPFLECFSAAQGAAATIFRVIDRKSRIDSLSTEGKQINYGVVGNIEFNGVHFHYPSRTDVPILNGITTKISSGETVALVGSSGNGKSTCIQLMQRFYDPERGNITIDGHDIKYFNLHWLRSNMACVGQEPVLFATTIEENIRYGKPDATLQEIHEAARSAGAHDFIVRLQDGYKTLAGERGAQLSGGQKQRIAIARALIQNPKILLLDEATSALDSHSEKVVQQTLDKASKGRTTIVVSHRLSAIKNADRIIFLEAGRIVEDGTHEQLIKAQGAYYNMMRGSMAAAAGAGGDSNDGSGANSDVDDEDALSLGGGVANDVCNEHVNDKVVEKQMFTQSQQLHAESANSVAPVAQAKLPDDESKPEKEDPVRYLPVLGRILQINRPELFYLCIASVASLVVGCSFGGFSILFGEFYGAMSLEEDEAKAETNKLCIAFLVMGVVVGVAAFLQTYLFNMASVYLTTRVRAATLESMIQQDCEWYDDQRNAVGALSVRLTADAAAMQGAIGYPLSGIIQSVATFVFGVAISFTYLWKMALVILPTAPLVVMSVLFEAKYMAKTAAIEATGMEEVTKVATEAISNIRTVASLRQETYIFERYCVEIAKLEKVVIKKMSLRGLVNSTGMSIPFFGYALALYYGGMMVANEGVLYKDIIKVSEGLLYGTMMLGQTLAFAPAFTGALVAGQRIFKVIDHRPSIVSPAVANRARKPDLGGSANFKQITFRYPTRPDVQILDGLNLDVLDGQTVALVGASGCGKSTVIQLLQRLYDPELGRVYLGLDEISSDIGIAELRSKLSIVSQEPILFDRTIAENIAYGDNARQVDMFDVMNAAKTANIHEFIAGLPLGYETTLGAKGAQLSGGQKQRIAIARALVRNPRVLLLDEATSALDLHSEQVVQQALDTARAGRTCLVIAHRLSTIQNADVICVIQLGRVCELGTHAQLMAKGGIYARLYRTQPTLH